MEKGTAAVIEEIINGAYAKAAQVQSAAEMGKATVNDVNIAEQMAHAIKVALTGEGLTPKAAANAAAANAAANAQRIANAQKVTNAAAANAQRIANTQRAAAAAANVQRAAAANANANTKKSAEEKMIDEGVDTSFFLFKQNMVNKQLQMPDESTKESFIKHFKETLNEVKKLLTEIDINEYIYVYAEIFAHDPDRTPDDIVKEIREKFEDAQRGGYRKRSTRKHKKARKHRKSRTR
jgi:hypothetical protein